MPKIHVISLEEAESLQRGEPIHCRNHYHIDREEAVDRFFVADYGQLARWAVLPSGRVSNKHIVQIQSRILKHVGITVQLVPGAAPLKDGAALGNWEKRRWTKKPRGFVKPYRRPIKQTTSEGEANAGSCN